MIQGVIEALSGGTVEFGIGLILLLAARQMYAGIFTLGDFALFVAYVWPVTEAMRFLSYLITAYQQSYVAVERLEGAMAGQPGEAAAVHDAPGAVAAHHPVYLRQTAPPIPFVARDERHALHNFRAEGLSYCFPGGENGIADINFAIQPGTVTIVPSAAASVRRILTCVMSSAVVRDTRHRVTRNPVKRRIPGFRKQVR